MCTFNLLQVAMDFDVSHFVILLDTLTEQERRGTYVLDDQMILPSLMQSRMSNTWLMLEIGQHSDP